MDDVKQEEPMMFSRYVCMTATVVMGLMFLVGTGCGPKNEGEKVAIQFLQRDLAKAEAEKAAAIAKTQCVANANGNKDAIIACGI